MPGTFSDLTVFLNTSPFYLIFLVCWGLSAVGAGFLISMPIVGAVLSNVWIAVIGERVVANVRGQPSQSDMGLD